MSDPIETPLQLDEMVPDSVRVLNLLSEVLARVDHIVKFVDMIGTAMNQATAAPGMAGMMARNIMPSGLSVPPGYGG